MRAPPRAVFLPARGHVARAHGAAIIFTACSESDAAQRCFSQRAVVLRKLEMSLGLLRMVIRTETQIFCWQIWIDYLVRIEFIFGIPDALEFSECLHQFRAKHFWKECGARLPVSVLAGKRSSIGNHEVGGAIDELTVFANTRFAFQVEGDAHVYAAVPKMSVERAVISIFVHQAANIAQIAA